MSDTRKPPSRKSTAAVDTNANRSTSSRPRRGKKASSAPPPPDAPRVLQDAEREAPLTQQSGRPMLEDLKQVSVVAEARAVAQTLDNGKAAEVVLASSETTVSPTMQRLLNDSPRNDSPRNDSPQNDTPRNDSPRNDSPSVFASHASEPSRALGLPSETDRRATDSKPPLPSPLSLRPNPLGVVKPKTERPRVSVRPSNFLTGYDLAMDRESLKVGVAGHIEYTQGKDEFTAGPLDYFAAAARATRDRMFDRWNKTQQEYYRKNQRRVYYLSLEYLLGRMFEDALLNLGVHETMQGALSDLGVDMADLVRAEPDAGLGNGGLGRLAACFLDSMATLGIAGTGYGIRYEYGIFEQQIVDGKQVERADNWLRYGSPWEVPRTDKRYLIKFGGEVVKRADASGRMVFDWNGAEHVWAMAHDYLVPGYGNDTVNTLRLWSAVATRGFSFDYFNSGDY
ncbi:MAG TPA: glycogen/starch/alpha-glucan phosphorylase, partial [Polyangiaceae bacterium]|nr:glycogen/starch/alpha-glucan phosphorylase [Polyangiaceae bacterium]